MMSADAGALLSGLKTGDLVLFAGQGLTSGLFKWLGRNACTHVGLVLREPEDAEPRLWEAVREGPRRGTLRGAPRGAHGRVSRQDERALPEPAAGWRAVPESG